MNKQIYPVQAVYGHFMQIHNHSVDI